jgi:sRNA-binding protein
MTKKILAVTFLSLVLSACESTGTDNTNANTNQKPANQTASTPAPPSPTPAASPAAAAQLKAGDAVKVSTNGLVAEATVVSVDEKTGKVTVKLKSDGKAKTVAMSDIVK